MLKMGVKWDPVFTTSPASKRDSATDAGTTFPRQIAICTKAGAPATNTADDCPTGVGDLCWDSTNDDVYRCTAYTSTAVFTWAKIID